MLDILWLVGSHKNNVVTESSKELFWEDTFRNIIPDGNIRKVFLKIIYNNLTDNECIIYRQDIIKDFLDNRQLMEDILSFIEKADVFCDEYNNAIKTTKNILNDTRNSETLSGAISSLQITSFFFKRITHLILKLKESFSLYNIKSYGLLSIKTRLAELEDKIYNTQVINIISDLENIHIDETNASFYLHLNENGRIGEINLNNVYSSFLNDKKSVTRLFKRKRNIQFSANVRYSEETNKIISQEILNISDIIYDITRSIIIEFGALKNGICFYKGGIQVFAAMIGKKESEISKWLKGTHNFTLRTIAKISAVLEEPIIEVAGEHKTNNEYVFINLIDSSPKTNISNRSKSISIRDNSDYTPVLWNNFSFCTANNDMIN